MKSSYRKLQSTNQDHEFCARAMLMSRFCNQVWKPRGKTEERNASSHGMCRGLVMADPTTGLAHSGHALNEVNMLNKSEL